MESCVWIAYMLITSDGKSTIWMKSATFLLCDVYFPLEIVERQFDRMKYAPVWVLHFFKQFAGD